MKDKYDLAVEYLTAYPEEIYTAWENPKNHQAGQLFKYVRKSSEHGSAYACGCPTMIRAGRVAYDANGLPDQKLTNAIASDKRLPRTGSLVTVSHLPVFAEWQRRIDKYYETGVLDMGEAKPQEIEYTLEGKKLIETPSPEEMQDAAYSAFDFKGIDAILIPEIKTGIIKFMGNISKIYSN